MFEKESKGVWYGFPGESLDFQHEGKWIHLPAITYKPHHEVRWSKLDGQFGIATLWILADLPTPRQGVVGGALDRFTLTRALPLNQIATGGKGLLDHFVKSAFRDWELHVGGHWLMVDDELTELV